MTTVHPTTLLVLLALTILLLMSTGTTSSSSNDSNHQGLGVYRYRPTALAESYRQLQESADSYVNQEIPSLSRRQDDDDATTTTTTTTTPPATMGRRGRPAKLVVAATQLTGAGLPDSTLEGYCQRAEQAIVKAIEQEGAHIVLLPELWSGPYFCQSQEASLLTLADPIGDDEVNHKNHNQNKDPNSHKVQHVLLRRMQRLAQHFQVVLPISVYERCNNVLYNSIVVFDADGTNLGTYRKSHIPDGPGYQEKFYFSPGDTQGMGVFDSHVLQCRLGVAICWDQWFPETARCLALQGCQVLLYPTAIGSEPQDHTLHSADHWQRVMQGHAAANMIPVVASNRFGTEILLPNDDDTTSNTERQRIHFYGKSFVTDHTGAMVAQCADNTAETPVGVVATTIDIQQQQLERAAWGLFRDRRPDLYGILLTKDGRTPAI